MLKRRYWGIAVIVLTAVLAYFLMALLFSDHFKATNLIYALGLGALTLHWFGAWVLMGFSNQNNNALNLTGQLFNLIAGLILFLLLITGANIEVYWNWMLSIGVLGMGFVAVFIAGAYETQFRLLPWVSNFTTTIWVVFSIFALLQKAESPVIYSVLFYGWFASMLLTLVSALTGTKA